MTCFQFEDLPNFADNISSTAILFDGALPDTKQAERLSRTGRYNQQVNGLRSNYPSTTCPIPTALGSVSYAFLAPSLREDLMSSEFAHITRNVPGEADDWCALQAREHSPSIVFSDDTDLLLYDYPQEFRLLFYRDVELWPEPKFKGYSPHSICKELDLSTLLSFAYCLTRDPHASESKLIGEAKSIDTTSHEFNNFAKRYSVISIPTEPTDPRQIPASLQDLDVRTSEFIHQTLCSRLAPVVYLPFLVEDQYRASAWSHGQEFRTISYSLFAADRSIFQEYRRKAQKITIQDIESYPPQELLATVETYTHSIKASLDWIAERSVPPNLTWPLFAIGIVLPDLKSPPHITRWLRILSGDFDNTWDFIHLTACLHAALYSLRFLKQCVQVWLSLNENNTSPLHLLASRLHTDLESLGTITELFLVPGQMRTPQGDGQLLRGVIAEVYASANIEEPVERKSNKKAKKQQREVERKERRKQENGAQTGSNSFDVLAFMSVRRS